MALTGIWYVIGFAFAAGSFAFLTFGAAWLISHRNRGDVHKGLPYESGIDTYGDTHGRFGLSFYIYALLFVAFDIEVIFIYLWALIFGSTVRGSGSANSGTDPAVLFASMFVFVGILLFGLAYAWRKGVLSWRGPGHGEVLDRIGPMADAEPATAEPVVIER
jgi:NADH:ubiquinone oxidoreductase subunit 3 (subunit A)